MTTRKSSFNPARTLPLIKNVLWRYRGMFWLYTALSLLFLPAPFLLSLHRIYERAGTYAQYDMTWYSALYDSMTGASKIYNYFSAIFYVGLLMVVPIVVSCVLFSYMHSRRSTDAYHSLPLTRGELFFTMTVAGCVIMFLPLVLCFVIMGVLAAMIPLYSVAAVAVDFLFWAACMLALFAVTSFCATQVGTVQDQVMYSVLVSCSFSGAVLMLFTLADEYLYGFKAGHGFLSLIYRICPFSLMIGRNFISEYSLELCTESNIAAAVWFVAALVLLLVSARLYARRKSEQAEVVGNLGFLQAYARLVGTLIGGIALAWVATAVLSTAESGAVMLVFIAIGGLIVYFIGDFILARRVRGLRGTCRGAIVTVAIVCLLSATVIFDFTGFEKRVPAAENVASVEVSGFDTRYSGQYYKQSTDTLTLTDADDIAAVLAAHTAQVGAGGTGYNVQAQNLSVTYNLRNGGRLTRAYTNLCPAATEALFPLETSDEILRQTAAIFAVDAESVSDVSVTRASDSASTAMALTSAQAEALVTALQIDLLNQPQSELDEGARGIAYVDVTVKILRDNYKNQFPIVKAISAYDTDDEIYYFYDYRYLITDSFEKTISFLQSAGLGEYLTDSSENIFAAGVVLYGNSWSDALYNVADGDEPTYDYWEQSYESDTARVNSPVVLLTREEYSALNLKRSSYCRNTTADGNETVAIVFYDSPTFEGESLTSDGGYYTRLSDLPDSLRERVISAWCDYNEILRDDFESAYFGDTLSAEEVG